MHIEYVIFTMNKNTYRIAIGNREGYHPIVYLLVREADDPDHGFYSYCMYLNLMTEAEGLEIQSLLEVHRFRSAYCKMKSYLKRDNPGIMKYGPCGPVELSDAVPDEWFDGCKTIIDLLPTKITDIILIDIEEGIY